MSSVIDERVVQMSFDNDQFEKGVSQTIKSLNKLDKTLVDTADGEYFTKMEERISRVEQAFTKSGMVINGILIGIGQTINQYINKGLAALTQGIRSGMQEYETQMGATQTILANVKDEGKGIADVTAALDELNTYADKTIYNFTEMTRNIGMFTAAGANLDTSVATIKGLANAAALVGANATTAARAWYQVSQAMAAGSFKLMDWRSLEISNIAGEGFKSVLTEVARKDGLAVAKMIDNGTALRDTLKDGWLTAERFAEAMMILTNEWKDISDYTSHGYTEEQAKMLMAIAQEAEYAAIKVKSFGQLMETTAEAIGSGWAVTFRTLIGDFERARDFYTRISVTIGNVIDKISDYRNNLLDKIWNWAPSGGFSPYDNFKRTLDNLLAIFSTFIGAIRAGFDNVFKWTDMNSSLGRLTNFFKRATDSLVLNDAKYYTNWKENQEKIEAGLENEIHTLDDFDKANYWDLDAVNENIKNLIRIFRGLFSGIDIIFTTIGDTIGWILNQIPGISNFFENLENGNKSLIGGLADIMDKVTMVRDMIVDLNLIPNILNLIKKSIIDIIKNNPLLMGIINAVNYAITVVKAFIATLKELDISPINILLGVLKLVGGAIAAIFYGISEAINKIIQFITGNVNFSFFESIGQEIMTFIVLLGELGKGTISVADVFDYYKKKVIMAFESIMRSPFVEGFIKFFTNAWNTIKTFWSNVVNFFTNLGDNISSFYEEYFGDFNFDIKDLGLFGVLTTIGILLYKFTRDVEGWASIGSRIADVLNAFANKVNSEALLNLAKAIGILAASVLVLSLIPYKTLINTVSMITVLIFMFMALFAVIKKTFDALEAVKSAVKPLEKIGLNLSKGFQRLMQRLGTAAVLEAIGDALIKITIAIVGLALAFKFLPNEMGDAIKVIAGVGIALGILIGVLSYFTSKSGMSAISGITDYGKLLNLAITSFLGAVSQAARMVAIAVLIEAFGDAIIKLSVALLIIGHVAQDTDALWNAVGALSVITVLVAGVISLFYVLSSKLALTNMSTLIGLSVLIIAFGGMVAVLGVVAALIGNVDWLTLLIGVGTIAAIMFSIAGSIALMSKFIRPDTAVTFLAFSSLILALSAGLAAVTYTSSLIQNGTQIAALITSVSGMAVLLGEIIGLIAIMKMAQIDFKAVLSISAVIGAIAIAFVAIGVALKQLDSVRINPTTILTLVAIMGALQLLILEAVGVGVVAAIAEAIVPGLGVIVIAAIGVIAALIAAIGGTVYLLSLAVLNIQEAIYNFLEALVFLSTQGEYFISTIKGAAETIIKSIPYLYTLFASIGYAVGLAISAILIGLKMVIDSIVLESIMIILTVLSSISDWVNNNASFIQTAFIKIFIAIINIAVIALNVVLLNILPILMKMYVDYQIALVAGLMQILLSLSNAFYSWLGELLLESNNKLLRVVGVIAIKLSEIASGLIDDYNIVKDEAMEITDNILAYIIDAENAIGFINDSTQALKTANIEATDSIALSFSKSANVVLSSAKTAIDANDSLSESTVDLADTIEKNTERINEYEKAEAKSISDTNDLIENDTITTWDSVISITDKGLEVNTDAIVSAFQLDLANQAEYQNAWLGNEDWFGSEANASTADWLLVNADLYSQFYSGLEEDAKTYYENMVAYTNAMTGPGVDNSVREAAQEQLKAAKEALNILNGGKTGDKNWSMKKVLEDNITWISNSKKVKDRQEAYFDSWTSLGNSISEYMANYSPSEVDTSMYSPNFGSSGTDTSKLQSELKDRNDLIKGADSELTPKDLTPTIDLDKLKNEVNQANGIMTGSLLAAQNAAIGDYINTDSELNPFLKDRWQNTYNFTQNNYSPKALSRIDIYRQTQNQLRLSRGF